jgi:hypothetical protein
MSSNSADQIEWLQKVNTLHRQVDILYVVDGYEVTIIWDDNPISGGFHGETVAEAISKAMTGFDLGEKPKWLDKDIYGHERQMAALQALNDDLVGALDLIAGMHDFEASTGALAMSMYEASCIARSLTAKARGEK